MWSIRDPDDRFLTTFRSFVLFSFGQTDGSSKKGIQPEVEKGGSLFTMLGNARIVHA